jgi:GMP synthase PP-ATPase subunit
MAAQPKTRQAIAVITRELPFDEMVAKVASGASQRELAALVSERIGKELPVYYINKWIHADAERSEAWKLAKEQAANYHADKVQEAAQDVVKGTLDPNSARTAIQAHQWLAARLSPKQWGDKLQVDANITDTTALHLAALRERMRTVNTVETESVDGAV